MSNLIEILAAHRPGGVVPASLKAECLNHVACLGCSWISHDCKTTDPYVEFAAHLAVLIAATHAVIELPKPWMEGSDAEWTDGIITAHIGSGKVRCYLEDGRMTSDDAREIGAGLIAAAAAADTSEVSS